MTHRSIVPLLILTAAGLLRAQGITEYGTNAASSSKASPAATGKSVNNVFGKVGQTLAGAAKVGDNAKPSPPQPSKTTAAAAVASAPKPAAPIAPPDLTALANGMDRADMLKKVGKPSMSMSSMESSSLVETCWYKNGDDSVTVTLRDGKVAAFDKISPPKP